MQQTWGANGAAPSAQFLAQISLMILAFLLASSMTSCSSRKNETGLEDESREALRNGPSEQIDLARLLADEGSQRFETSEVVVDADSVFNGQRKTYEAFDLLEILKTARLFQEASAPRERSRWGVTFVALDRFRVTLPMSMLFDRKAYLAVRESGRRDGQDWGVIPGRLEALTPDPFYLIWEDQEENDLTRPNPYQVAFLVIEPLGRTYADAFPSDGQFEQGFRDYTSSCVWCHSVNYVGGRSQREFNVPESYTTTVSRSEFIGIMKKDDPSKNCSLAGFYQESFYDSVYSYLEHMSSSRLCTSETECKAKEPQ